MKKEWILLLLFIIIKTTQAQDNCNTGSSGVPFNTISTDPTNVNTGPQYPNNSSGPMGFNWWQPQTFNVFTQHGLTIPDAVLYSPFYCGGGSGYLDGACGNTNLEKYSDIHNDPNGIYNNSDYAKWKAMDILPEDGWELIKYNFGKAASGTYTGAEAKMPFFIIYNRYTGKMKFFIAMTGLQGQVMNNQGATIKIYMSGQNQTSGDVRDIFAHATSISKTFKAFDNTQYFTVPNGLAAIGASPPSPFEYMWLYAEVPISYDPCTCDNLSSHSATTQVLFDVYTFQSTNINETVDGTFTAVFATGGELNSGLHSVATSNPTEASGTSTYGSSVNSALSTFKDWSDYGEAIKKLNDNGTSSGVTNNYYYNSLNQSYSAATGSNIETNNTVSASTVQSLAGVAATEVGTAAVAEGGLADAVPYVGIFIGLIDFITTMTQSDNSSSSSATNATTVSAPTVYHVNGKITGTETSESLQNGGGFYLPGSYANHDFTTAGQYNEDEQFPIYNNTLGIFNLIDIPTIQYTSIDVTNEGVPSGQPSNAQSYTPNSFFQDYKLSDNLKYVINPAANLTVLSIDAAFVFEYKNSDYLYYSPGSGGFTQTLYYPNMSTAFHATTNTHTGDDLGTIITNLKSSGIALEYQSVDYQSSVPSQNPSGSYIRFRTNYVPLQCLQNVDFILCGNGPQPTTYIKLYCKFKRNDNGNVVTAVYTIDASSKYATSNVGTQTSGSIYSYDYCAGYTDFGGVEVCTNVSDYFFKDLYLYGAYFTPNYSDQPGSSYTSYTKGVSSTGSVSVPDNSNVYYNIVPATSYVTISSMQDVNIGNSVRFNDSHSAGGTVPNALNSAIALNDINAGTNLTINSPTNFYAGHNVSIADNAGIYGFVATHDPYNYETGKSNIYAKNEIAITNHTANATTQISGEVTLGINNGLAINGILHGCNNPDDINNYKASSSDISSACSAASERLMASSSNDNKNSFIQPAKKTDITPTKLGAVGSIKLGIYPNPTSGVVYLNLNAQNVGNLLVSINTTGGSQVLQNTFSCTEGANSFKVDLSGLTQGVYFINITDENRMVIKNDKIVLMPN